MTTVLFVRRFLADYARNPVNLLLIIVAGGVRGGSGRARSWPRGAPTGGWSSPGCPRPAGTVRLTAGLALAILASAAALAALAARTGGIAGPGRVIAGTLMFAGIYLAIGALAGALVPSPLNGTLLILFVWIVDVFLGPAFGTAGQAATRVLPTHYITLWMTGLKSGLDDRGRRGSLGRGDRHLPHRPHPPPQAARDGE